MKVSLSFIIPWIMCGPTSAGATELLNDAHDVLSHTNDQALKSQSDSRPRPASATTTVALTRIPDAIFKHEASRGFMSGEESEDAKRKGPTPINLVGTSYVAHVTIGTQIIPLLVDTGSSDLWVAPSSFVCLDARGEEAAAAIGSQGPSACGFPSSYDDDDDEDDEGTAALSRCGAASDEDYFSVAYADGQFAHGPYGRASVSLGGVTVPDQQIALPSRGHIRVSSGDYAGLLGLGYPAMVAARRGGVPRPAVGNEDPFGEYETWFFSAFRQNLTDPLFSMALDIDGGGLLGIGGVVDVPIVGEFVSTPILMMNLVNETRAETSFTFYTIIADDYVISGQSSSKLSSAVDATVASGFPVIVDSGYSTNVLPPSLVTLFYDTFDEPPQPVGFHDHGSMFAAPCDADVSSFGVQIGGRVLEMAREAILVSRINTTVDGVAVCGLGIQPGIERAGALGDTFLSGVVAVFDVGASEMRFAQRDLESSPVEDEEPGVDTGGPRDEF